MLSVWPCPLTLRWPGATECGGGADGAEGSAEDVPTQRQVEAAMERYAHKTFENACWLDWLDAALVASNNKKALGIIQYTTAEAKLSIDHVSRFLQEIPGGSPENRIGDFTLNKDKSSWLLLSCSASYQPSAVANHWVPCVFQEQVDPGVYAWLVDQQIAANKVAIVELECDLADLDLDPENEENCLMRDSIFQEMDRYLAQDSRRANIYANIIQQYPTYLNS